MTCFVSGKSNLRCQLIAQSLRSVKQNVHLDGEGKDRWVKFSLDIHQSCKKHAALHFKEL